MTKIENERWEIKTTYGYGNTSVTWLGRYIKEFRYKDIPLGWWLSEEQTIVLLDYRTQILTKFGFHHRYHRYYRCRPQTLRYKYNQFLPPGVRVISKRGRTGGFWVVQGDKDRISLGDRTSVKYEGIL